MYFVTGESVLISNLICCRNALKAGASARAVRARGKKGKMVNIPLLPTAGDLKGGDTAMGSVFWLIVELNKLFVFF